MKVQNNMCSSRNSGQEKDRYVGESKGENALHHRYSEESQLMSDGL